MFAFVKDKIVEQKNAVLHISDLSIQRGYGIFDFFRTQDGVLLYVENHLDRFYHSAKQMHLHIPLNRDDLRETIEALALKNNLPDAGTKLILTGGYSEDGYQLAASNLIIVQAPLTIASPKELSVVTHDYVREFADVKTTNYTMGIWLQHKLSSSQADDILYCSNQIVSEFPRSNFFIVTKEKEIITPAENILKGVTRKHVMMLAGAHYTVKEETVTLETIAHAAEAFQTGSTRRIQPVVRIDGRPVGDGKTGPVTEHLRQLLVEHEKAYIAKRK